MWEMIAYRISVGNLFGDAEMDVREFGCELRRWMVPGQVLAVRNLRVLLPQSAAKSP
jgi:hypothetical protein